MPATRHSLAILLLALTACTDRIPSAPGTTNTPAPTLVRARENDDRTATAGAHFLYDVTQGGSTFAYTGKERVTYSVVFSPTLSGLSVADGLVNGVAHAPGTITAYVRATAGALEARDTFDINVTALPLRVDVPNATRHAMVQRDVEIDPTNGGVTFIDPHGTGLTLSVEFSPSANGMRFENGRIVGKPQVAGVIQSRVRAQDLFGSAVIDEFDIVVHGEGDLVVVSPNVVRSATAGAHVDLDVAKNGTLLNRAASTYSVSIDPAIPGLRVEGNRIVGTAAAPGLSTVTVNATADGQVATDVFTLVVFSPSLRVPSLPGTLQHYGPPDVPLPTHFVANVPLGDDRNPITSAGATLGRVLFYDKRLSRNDVRSCGSCHRQQFGFGDSTQFAPSLNGLPITRHSMSLANNRFHVSGRFFWDERASSLEAAVLQPVQDNREMGLTLSQLVAKVSATPFYAPLFKAAFGTETISSERIAFALAQFIRSMVSANSKFDAAFAGGGAPDFERVFTAEELRGKVVFENVGNCAECHELNAQVSDMVHNNGLDPFNADDGAGRGRFRAPSLRNVAVRGRFMHDGRFKSIEEVIDFYDAGVQPNPFLDAQLQAGGAPLKIGLNAFDKQALAAFLRTLTDEDFLADPRFADPFSGQAPAARRIR